jgi:hypothetical protein
MLEVIGSYILTMVCCTVLLFVVHEVFRRFLKLTIVFFVLACFSFPLWDLGGWFLVLKTILMLAAAILISLTRLGYALPDQKAAPLRNNLFLWIIYLALVANIAVALIPDIEAGNYYNAFAGLLLAILVPHPPDGWRIDTLRYNHHDLLVDLPIVWCLLYVSWWMNLVYDVWPDIFSRGLCLMLVTLIPLAVFRRSDLWLSIRAYTLAFYMLTISLFDYSIRPIDAVVPHDDEVMIAWGVVNLSLHAVYAVWWFGRGRKRFKEQFAPAAR